MVSLFSTEQLNATAWPKRWLWLGISALAVAGIFAIILVMARTPQLAVFTGLFSVALVVHVDLSVLVWFLAMLGFCWSYLENGYDKTYPYFQATAFSVCAVATALIALSPLYPQWEVIKSNYIPVLYNPLFLGGLSLLMASMVVAVIPIITRYNVRHSQSILSKAIFWSAWIIATALLAFFASAITLDPTLPLDSRYETLFWAGGHILQYAFTQLAIIGWLTLLYALGHIFNAKTSRIFSWFLPFGYIASLLALLAFILYPVGSPEFITYFTHNMRTLGGIAPVVFMIYSVVCLIKADAVRKSERAIGACLAMSLLVFAAGGGVAFLIQGQNVTIPAHYHGSIVGVTLALMGMVYHVLPALGYRQVSANRLAFWQPVLYGGGQLLHIAGLAYSGGYGVLRKYTGEVPIEVKAAMGVMGLGGTLAIIGGILFVIVVARAAAKPRE